jgi:hypothetical protein
VLLSGSVSLPGRAKCAGALGSLPRGVDLRLPLLLQQGAAGVVALPAQLAAAGLLLQLQLVKTRLLSAGCCYAAVAPRSRSNKLRHRSCVAERLLLSPREFQLHIFAHMQIYLHIVCICAAYMRIYLHMCEYITANLFAYLQI